MIRNHFDSVDEFCSAPFKLKENEAFCCRKFQSKEGYWLADEDSEAPAWLGTRTVKEAAERVTKGWKEGADKVLSNMESIEVELPVSVRRKLARADQGDELDIHTVYRGDLSRAWTRRARKHTRSPLTVRIVVQTNLLSNMNPEQLFWRGAAALKLSDLLTNAGYNVEIIGALASKGVCGKDVDFLATMTLKESKQPLDVEQLAGVICNAGFHRLYGFRGYLALAEFEVREMPGASVTEREGRIIREAGLTDEGVMTFVTPYSVSNKAAAERFVTECCEKLNQPQEVL